MKKNLFLIAAFSGFVFSQAQVATAFVKGDTNVKVKQNTLFYVGGDVKVGSYTDNSNSKVSNEGNIRVTGNFTNENIDSNGRNGKNFVNEYVKGNHYGQLIIDGQVSGEIEGDLELTNNIAYHPISLPFSNYTYEDMVRDAFAGKTVQYHGYNPKSNKKYDPNRYKNPVFVWNNKTFTLDHVVNSTRLTPGNYYAVNTMESTWGAIRGQKTQYFGEPQAADVSITLTGYEVPNKLDLNAWGEAYGSYISDFTKEVPNGWNTNISGGNDLDGGTFGDNIFWLGNPFTSNVDLGEISNLLGGKVTAIYQGQSNKYTRKDGNGEAVHGKVNASLIYTKNGTGDASALKLRPYHTLGIKAEDLSKGETQNFVFKQAMKTFNIGSDTPNTVLRRGNSASVVYQAGMDIYDAQGNDTNSRFYVVAGDIYEAEAKGEGIEIYNTNFNDAALGAYTLQEKEDGSVAENLVENKVYINGVNFKYAGKPIQVVFNAPEAGNFTFKTRLNETLENSKYNFYFEDKKEGVVKKVTPDFEYSFTANGKETDRFVMYWMQTPSQLAPKEIEEVRTPQTIVFKDFDTHKVRFDSDWKSADVYVYSINGQLLYADKKVSTQNDYTLRLGNSTGVYVVKAVADNGEEVTKKIIK
ncbi:Por secretion system C-terminal sorting domain [Candidatus Ornithobacterium hominis]|uniref:T9SS type A sorting domain-containing protein n=1 Tax=Candidatus Ornithobacterium hominis TaxID=2497989 RepID=UPI000E5BA5F2|nr:T9SS type A sorting domain-containing protein [Candidatus Ornithobacterium hominis]SZD72557.1 Por secretion system C-terminal sorting domain [Candidatus Ornithobacterium hominis]